MHQPRRLRLAASVVLCCVLLRAAQCADKYTDENRPYEFGFKIDGEQHRHESKDKDGIIMGEFGFITADDVYHVTVYATDKEGHFKILSMKNMKSSSASTLAPTAARQGHALALPPAQPASVQALVVPQQPLKQGRAPTPPQIRPFLAQAPAPQEAVVPQAPALQGAFAPQVPVPQGAFTPQARALQGALEPQVPVPQGAFTPQAKVSQGALEPQVPGPQLKQSGAPTLPQIRPFSAQAPARQEVVVPQVPALQGAFAPQVPVPQGAITPQAKASQGGLEPQVPVPHLKLGGAPTSPQIRPFSTRAPAPQGAFTPQAKASQGALEPQVPVPEGAFTPQAKASQGALEPQVPVAQLKQGGAPTSPQIQSFSTRAPAPHEALVPQAPSLQGAFAPQVPIPQGAFTPQAKASQGALEPQVPVPQGVFTPRAKASQGILEPQVPGPQLKQGGAPTSPQTRPFSTRAPAPQGAFTPQAKALQGALEPQVPVPEGAFTPQAKASQGALEPQVPVAQLKQGGAPTSPQIQSFSIRAPVPHEALVPQAPSLQGAFAPQVPVGQGAFTPQAKASQGALEPQVPVPQGAFTPQAKASQGALEPQVPGPQLKQGGAPTSPQTRPFSAQTPAPQETVVPQAPALQGVFAPQVPAPQRAFTPQAKASQGALEPQVPVPHLKQGGAPTSPQIRPFSTRAPAPQGAFTPQAKATQGALEPQVPVAQLKQGGALTSPQIQPFSPRAPAPQEAFATQVPVPQGAFTPQAKASQAAWEPQVPVPQGAFTPQAKLSQGALELQVPVSQGALEPQAPVPQGAFAPQPGKPNKLVSIEPPGKSCSSCSLPTTTTRPPSAYNQVVDNKNYNSSNQFGAPGASPQNQQAFPPSTPGQQNIAQDGPIGSSYSLQGGQPNYSPGQLNILEQGLITPSGAPSFAPLPGQTPKNYLNSPNDSQKLYTSKTYAQPRGEILPSTGQTQEGAKTQVGSTYSPQGGQRNYSSGQQNIPKQGLITQGGAPSFAPQPGQTPQNYLNSPNDSQKPYIPKTYAQPGGEILPSTGQTQEEARTQVGSTYSPQGGQRNYSSGQQNIPEQGLITQGGAPSFAPQPGQTPQNYLNSPNDSQKPYTSNTYTQPGGEILPSTGQTQEGARTQVGSTYSPQGGQRNYSSGQQNIPEQGFIAPGGAPFLAPQPRQTPPNYVNSPNDSQKPYTSNTYTQPGGEILPSTGQTQGGAGTQVGSSYSPQGGQRNYSSGQQNIPEQGLIAPDGAPSFAPQPDQTPQNYLKSPNDSQKPYTPNTYAQRGGEILPSTGQTQEGAKTQVGSTYSPQGGQRNYSSGQQNIPEKVLIAPGGAPSLAPQPGKTQQNYLNSLNDSQKPYTPNTYTQPGGEILPSSGHTQGGARTQVGSLYSPQGGQRNYSPGQQNIPEQGLTAPGGAPSFAPQSGQTPQNYLNSPNDSQKPYTPNTYAQPGGEILPSTGQTQGGTRTQAGSDQTNSGEQNRLFSGNNNPYAEAGPQGSATTTVPDAGTYVNGNGQQAGSPGQSFSPQGSPEQSLYPQGTPGQSSYPQGSPGQSSYPQGTPGQISNSQGSSGKSSYPQGTPGKISNSQGSPVQGSNPRESQGQDSYPQGLAAERTAKQYNGPRQRFDSQLKPNGSQGLGAAQGQPGSKPTLFSAQMQIVDKNTDIYALGPNEQKGLPPGLAQSDVTTILYTFNYTVGFHGHFEEGFKNGSKKGYYFVTGRNGVRTRIDYVADDTGFHPTVSQEVLDLLSEDVPKPETEKDEKYGLKGYEFKWLYYPVEPKKL